MESSSQTFAKLTPCNTAAKLAFDAMYESNPRTDRQSVYVHPEQQYDKDVLLFRLHEQKGSHGDTESDSPTDPDTDTEKALKHQGMIWSGWFTFTLDPGPYNPTAGWTVGKGRVGLDMDYLLIAPSRALNGLRGYHARFNFHEKTGYLFISKTSSTPRAEVMVNGMNVGSGEQFSLNQSQMNIRIGNFEFRFEYTDFAHTPPFYADRQNYMKRNLNSERSPNPVLTPTPNTFRCFGHWTIAASLGKGAYGRVSSATNSKGEILAVKIIERNNRTGQQGDRNRVLRLREAIYQNGAEAYAPTVFEEVALVLEPAVPATLVNIIGLSPDNPLYRDMCNAANLLQEALLGLNFLHSHNWVRGDLKPANIGIRDKGSPSIVLLDFEGAVNLPPGSSLPATPGRGGTVNYLAPERELQEHNHSIDIWSMGVIGFELLHGYHPWRLAVNPWRPGARCEDLRPTFHKMYSEAVQKLKQESNTEFNNLLLQMLRHQRAEGNSGTRISARNTLNHACWGSPERDEVPAKRKRH